MDGLDRQNRGCWAHYPLDPPAPDVILSPPGRAGRWYGPNHRRYRIHISNVSGRWFLSRPPCPIPFVQRRRAGSIPPRSEAWARCPLPLRRCQRCLIVSKVSYCVKGVLLCQRCLIVSKVSYCTSSTGRGNPGRLISISIQKACRWELVHSKAIWRTWWN